MAKHRGICKKKGCQYWYIRYAGPDGRMRFESTHSTSLKVAQDLRIKRKNEVLEGNDPTAFKRMYNYFFKELAEHYMTWAERQKCFRSKKYLIKDLNAEFGNLPLRRFSTRLIEEFQTRKLTSGKKEATANRYLATIKHMFTKAVEWEMVGEDVSNKVRKVKLLPENNKILRYLSVEECHSLIDVCADHLRPIVVTALNTGMRKEEILSLQRKQVDLKHGFILLDETKNGERRQIPINKILRETLQGLVRRLDSPYIFTNGKGERYKDVKRAWHSALKKASIEDFRFHDLRHTFASHFIMDERNDLYTLQMILGHKEEKMTKRYAHLSKKHMRNALSVMDDIYGVSSTVQKLYNSKEKGSSHDS